MKTLRLRFFRVQKWLEQPLKFLDFDGQDSLFGVPEEQVRPGCHPRRVSAGFEIAVQKHRRS